MQENVTRPSLSDCISAGKLYEIVNWVNFVGTRDRSINMSKLAGNIFKTELQNNMDVVVCT